MRRWAGRLGRGVGDGICVDIVAAARNDDRMACAHGLVERESIFTIDASSISFGDGAAAEAGSLLAARGAKRIGLFTDARVAKLRPVEVVKASLIRASLDVVVYDACRVEPKDGSVLDAIRFAKEARLDGYVSVGGGSSIDTCKLAALYAHYPADLLAYVNAPVGEGRRVPGPLPPHVACPTTSGTGSECTGIAVFDLVEKNVKTAVASRALRPIAALVDPTFTESLPAEVVAASGFDVLCHALESFTARRFTAREAPLTPDVRPMSQGQNPWSDLGSMEALRLAGKYFVRAVRDAGDKEARHGLSWAATLAGVAFGNAGVHLPHAMSYAVAGLSKTYQCAGYPSEAPFVPHGISVVVGAPSVFRATAACSPERHTEAAIALGAETRGRSPTEAGEILSDRLIALMRATNVPLGLEALGFARSATDALVVGTLLQKRLVDNAPLAVNDATMRRMFEGSFVYGDTP